ncbi:MAG: S8 family serine peptidase [Defluviitaleaceae bacterium]|nr:S8 family serine peptidase [Defluviitaleaceae bacterium]
MIRIRTLLSIYLAFVMTVASVAFPAHLVSATGNHHFTGNGFEIRYTVQSSWINGYSAALEIINTSSQSLEEWTLVINSSPGLNAGNISGGRILAQSAAETVIVHAEWNSVIPAGGKANLSFNGTHNGVTPVPTSFQLLSAKDANTASRRLIPLTEYTVEHIVHHETSDSFNNAIVLTNNTGSLIYGWEVEFDISPGAVIDNAFVANISQDVIPDGSRVTLSKITGSGIVWHPGMAMHIQLMGTKSSDVPVAFSNFAVYERTAGNNNTPTPTPTPTPSSTPTPEPTPPPGDMPYIRVLTVFPDSTVNSSFVDIKYIAEPGYGADVTEVFYSINGRVHDYIYWHGNATLGEARVFIIPGLNQLEFTVRDSLGRTANYAIENMPYFDPGVIAPLPEDKYKETSVVYDDEYFINNRLKLWTVWPNDHISHDEIINAIDASGLEAVGYSHVTGSYTVQVPQNNEAGLETLGESFVAAHPRLFEGFGLLGGFIDDDRGLRGGIINDRYNCPDKFEDIANHGNAVWPMPNPANVEYATQDYVMPYIYEHGEYRRRYQYYINNRLIFHSAHLSYEEIAEIIAPYGGTILGISHITRHALIEFPTNSVDELLELLDLDNYDWSLEEPNLRHLREPNLIIVQSNNISNLDDFDENMTFDADTVLLHMRSRMLFDTFPLSGRRGLLTSEGADIFLLNEAWLNGDEFNGLGLRGGIINDSFYCPDKYQDMANHDHAVWPMPNPTNVEYATQDYVMPYIYENGEYRRRYHYYINNRLIFHSAHLSYEEIAEIIAPFDGTILGISHITRHALIEFPTNSVDELLELLDLDNYDWSLEEPNLRYLGEPNLIIVQPDNVNNLHDFDENIIFDANTILRMNRRLLFSIHHLSGHRALPSVDEGADIFLLNEAWLNGGEFYSRPFRGYPGYEFDYGVAPANIQFEPFSTDTVSAWGLNYINMPCAWVYNEAQENHERKNVRIGIIDTSVQANHPLLEIPTGNVHTNIPTGHPHGTGVMGIIGVRHRRDSGTDPAINIARENLFAFDRNTASRTTGLEWNIIRGASVINLSQAVPIRDRRDFQTKMDRLLGLGYNFIVVQAVNNARENADNDKENITYTPSDASEEVRLRNRRLRRNIIMVGNLTPPDGPYAQPVEWGRIQYDPSLIASDHDGAGSSYGYTLDVLAPGTGIYVIRNGISQTPIAKAGASFAAAHVSALAALIWDEHPGFTGAEVRRIIIESSRHPSRRITDIRESLRNESQGEHFGRDYYVIDARAAMQLAESISYRASRRGRLVGLLVAVKSTIFNPLPSPFNHYAQLTLTPENCFKSASCIGSMPCEHTAIIEITPEDEGFYRFDNLTVLSEHEIQNLPEQERSLANRYRLTITAAGFHPETIYNVHIPRPGVSTRFDDIRLVPLSESIASTNTLDEDSHFAPFSMAVVPMNEPSARVGGSIYTEDNEPFEGTVTIELHRGIYLLEPEMLECEEWAGLIESLEMQPVRTLVVSNGNFYAEGLPPGNYTVIVSGCCIDTEIAHVISHWDGDGYWLNQDIIVRTRTPKVINDAFECPVFLRFVQSNLFKEHDDPVYCCDVADVTGINVQRFSINSPAITSLAGIEYFTSLRSLSARGNQITTVDFSNNRYLRDVGIWNNQLIELNVSKNIYLEFLNVNGNQLISLDLSSNRYLKQLRVGRNQLTNLVLPNSLGFEVLHAEANNLHNVDLSNNPALRWVHLCENRLTGIDLSNNVNLINGGMCLILNYITSINSIVGWGQAELTQGLNLWFDPWRTISSSSTLTPFGLEFDLYDHLPDTCCNHNEFDFLFSISDVPDPSDIPGKHFCTTNIPEFPGL